MLPRYQTATYYQQVRKRAANEGCRSSDCGVRGHPCGTHVPELNVSVHVQYIEPTGRGARLASKLSSMSGREVMSSQLSIPYRTPHTQKKSLYVRERNGWAGGCGTKGGMQRVAHLVVAQDQCPTYEVCTATITFFATQGTFMRDENEIVAV